MIYRKRHFRLDKGKGEGGERSYCCPYCSRKFKMRVRTSFGGKHETVSTQVLCECGNFLKTHE